MHLRDASGLTARGLLATRFGRAGMEAFDHEKIWLEELTFFGAETDYDTRERDAEW